MKYGERARGDAQAAEQFSKGEAAMIGFVIGVTLSAVLWWLVYMVLFT